MFVAVVTSVAILTALTLGYGFSQKDGKIEQGGLLQMSSTPTGATVTIDGVKFGSQTPTKLVSQVGNYHVEMQKNGYHKWQKTVPIQAGNITWVAYPRLIPQTLTPKATVKYPATTASALPSGSAKRYAVLTSADRPVVSVAMLDREEVTTKEYELPVAAYTGVPDGQPSRFAISEWTGDEKHVLLQHTFGPNNTVSGYYLIWIVPRNLSILIMHLVFRELCRSWYLPKTMAERFMHLLMARYAFLI